MIRDLVLALTLCGIICILANQPPKSRLVQTDYCKIVKRGAAKDELGQWHFGWTELYAPCDQQDSFREI